MLRSPKFWKWWNPSVSIHVDFGGTWNYADIKKTAASRIIQTIWNCKALHMLNLFLLIVKCPFNKIKILGWVTLALEKSFQLINSDTHLNSRKTVPLSNTTLHSNKSWKFQINIYGRNRNIQLFLCNRNCNIVVESWNF